MGVQFSDRVGAMGEEGPEASDRVLPQWRFHLHVPRVSAQRSVYCWLLQTRIELRLHFDESVVFPGAEGQHSA